MPYVDTDAPDSGLVPAPTQRQQSRLSFDCIDFQSKLLYLLPIMALIYRGVFSIFCQQKAEESRAGKELAWTT
ncbi:MAG TPA: hypothetical protein DGH68_01525 [Bacteroidetes bacterium]|nr:hypothetical protein [Bacteroidota bacterium]